ncbi:2192_t:CDS:2, partial [Gigaspora rosea]
IKYENILIEVFDFAYLDNDNRVIICAVSNYYNQTAFSDICIEVDELEQKDYLTNNRMCYAKITSSKLDQKLELALVY